MSENFEQMIIDAERELRDLKTVARQAGLVKCYSITLEAPPSTRCRVSYGDGIQPIISEFYYGGTAMPYKPNEEEVTQFVRLDSQSVMPLTIVSTRPILKVEAA